MNALANDQAKRFASIIADFLIRSARPTAVFRPIRVFLDGYQFHRKRVTEADWLEQRVESMEEHTHG